MDSLCEIKWVDMIFEWLPLPLSPIHTTSVSSLSQVLNFIHRFNYKDQGAFKIKKPQRRAVIGRWVTTKNKTLNVSFKHGQVNNYAVDYILNHPDTLKIQSSFWTELQDRKEPAQGCHHESIGDRKTEFNVCEVRKLRIQNVHASSMQKGTNVILPKKMT